MDDIFCEKCGSMVRPADYAQHALAHVKEKIQKKKRVELHRCEFCDKTYTNSFNFEYHVAHHRNLREFPCSECSRAFNTKADLTQHFKIHKFAMPVPSTCRVCTQQFPSELALKSHMKNQHKIEVQSTAKAEEPNFNFTCGVCGMSVTKMKAHYQMYHPEIPDYKCSECEVRFVQPKSLRRHLITVHKVADDTPEQNDDRVQCGLCGLYVRKIVEHVKAVHEKIKDFKCPLCDKRFHKSSGVTRHINCVHDKRKQFECPICQKTFGDSSYLFKHIRCHGDKKSSTFRSKVKLNNQGKNYCFLCRKDTVGDMRDHFKTVHPESKYECQICFRCYPRKESLTRHYNSFHEKSPVKYQCDMCAKYFIDKDNMRKHLVVHFGKVRNVPVKREPTNFPKKFKVEHTDVKVITKPVKKVASVVIKTRIVKKKKKVIKSKRKLPVRSVVPIRKSKRSPVIPETKTSNEIVQNETVDIKIEDPSDEDDHKDVKPDETVKIKEEVMSEDEVYVEPFPVIYCKEERMSENESDKCNNDSYGDYDMAAADDRYDDFSDSSDDVALARLKISQIKSYPETSVKEDKSKLESEIFDSKKNNQNKFAPSHSHEPPKCDIEEKCEKKVDDITEEKFEDNRTTMALHCDCPRYFDDIETFELHKKQTHMPGMTIKCDFCSLAFDTATKQRAHIRKKHKGQLAFNCKLCNKRFADSKVIITHNVKTHPEICSLEQIRERTCEYCSKIYNTKQHKIVHIRAIHSDDSFKCLLCPAEYSFVRALQRHVMTAHKGFKKYNCDLCGIGFSFKFQLTEHMLGQHVPNPVKKYKCLLCTAAYHSVHSLKAHDFDEHIKKPVLAKRLPQSRAICKYCGENCKRGDTRKRHYIKIHRNGSKPLRECLVCHSEFKLYSDYIDHIKAHNIEHICITCSFPCQTAAELTKHTQDHRRIKDEDKTFICDTCGRPHFSIGQLNIHKRTHTGERPYVCHICGQSFKFSSVFFYHKRKAHGIDGSQFICQTCGKTFNFRSELIIHQRIHTGENPYVCRICNEGFISKMKLNVHHQKHEETRKLKRCDICSETFLDNYQSRAHDVKFHPEKFQCVCNFCGERFRAPNGLSAHITKKHANETNERRSEIATTATDTSTKFYGIPGISYAYN